MATNAIAIYRGNDKTISLTVTKPDGTLYNLTTCTITLYVKRKITDIDSDSAITLTGTVTGLGVCEFYLVPATTNNATTLLNKVIYPYEIRVVTPTGKLYTVLRGSFVILEP